MKPRIYVACLAADNNGYLHGEWIDVNQDSDSLYADIKNILTSSPIPDAEEWGYMTLKILVISLCMSIPV